MGNMGPVALTHLSLIIRLGQIINLATEVITPPVHMPKSTVTCAPSTIGTFPTRQNHTTPPSARSSIWMDLSNTLLHRIKIDRAAVETHVETTAIQTLKQLWEVQTP